VSDETLETSTPTAVLDLTLLGEMHPRLPGDLAGTLAHRAALALGRSGHASGVSLTVALDGTSDLLALRWVDVDLRELLLYDYNRITEDGAEAVALAVGHCYRGWRVVRRMQREEYADWLLERTGEGIRELVALEVSGVDRGRISVRLPEKIAQVSRCTDVDQRWVSVVGFEKPCVEMKFVKADHDGP
jgi:hypothetical protein